MPFYQWDTLDQAIRKYIIVFGLGFVAGCRYGCNHEGASYKPEKDCRPKAHVSYIMDQQRIGKGSPAAAGALYSEAFNSGASRDISDVLFGVPDFKGQDKLEYATLDAKTDLTPNPQKRI